MSYTPNTSRAIQISNYDMIIGSSDEITQGIATHLITEMIDANINNNDRILILDGTHNPGVQDITKTGLLVRCQSYNTIITTDDALSFSGVNCDVELPNVSNSANVSVDGSGSRSIINNIIKSEAATLMPSGTILTFSGGVAPTGWLECNGANVSRTTYSVLFAVISTNYGEGDGSTTFTLPDLRGRFLRGWDHGVGRDPNSATRTAMETGG